MQLEQDDGGSAPGVTCTSVELSFFARSSPERWRQFMESIGCELRPSASDPQNVHRWYTQLAALPDDLKHPSSRYLSGDVHPMKERPEETHWTLRLELVPGPNPPASIVDKSRKCGGYPGILEKITAGWPTNHEIEDVECTVTFLLDEQVWRSPFAPKKRQALKPFTVDGQEARLSVETYSWKLEPPGLLRQVVDAGYIGPGKGGFALSCSGKQPLKLELALFSRVEVALWHSVRKFLQQKRSKRQRTT